MDSPAASTAALAARHEVDEWALVNDEAEIVESVPAEHAPPPASEPTRSEEEQTPMGEQRPASEPQNDAVPDGYLRVRLRIGENVRGGWFNATQSVEEFTKQFFADALANGKKIRLIYLGMLLIPGRSMGEYGVEEDGVIHCVITNAPRDTELKGLSNPSNMLLVLTGVFLYGLWTLFYYFPHFFSWKSIILLSIFSALHISASVSRFTSS